MSVMSFMSFFFHLLESGREGLNKIMSNHLQKLNSLNVMKTVFVQFKTSHRRYYIKKLFLKVSQNSQENVFVGVLIKRGSNTGVFL